MSNGIDHKNLDKDKEINPNEASGRDGEQPTKAKAFLIKLVWFFILWGTLHWIFN
jgi:hypothetical protein